MTHYVLKAENLVIGLGDGPDKVSDDLALITTPTRKPPRLDPVKSAAKMIAKNPALVARIKPDGEIEIASKTPPVVVTNEIDLDASVGSDVWDAIAAINDGGSHGSH